MFNISVVDDKSTANTNYICAKQRAENLYSLGIKTVLELCVGPSLSVLEKTYSTYNIKVTGNDIDKRWKDYYPQGSWLIGDARKLDTSDFDAVVVAPPLSVGCTGSRKDSLSLDKVVPSYYDFLHLNNKVIVFVLPGRTLSVKGDKEQLYKFLSVLGVDYEVVPLRNKVVKYVDVYWRKYNGIQDFV